MDWRAGLSRRGWRWGIGPLVALLALVFLPVGERTLPWQEELSERELAALGELAEGTTRAQAERDLTWLDPHGLLAPYVELDEAGLRWRVDDEAAWTTTPWRRPTAAVRPPLDGLRLMLDPGHYGGAWAEREQRSRALGDGEPVREGELTWATTRLVEQQLAAQGAVVGLTRGPPPSAPFVGEAPGFDPALEARQALAEKRAVCPLGFSVYPSLFGRWVVGRQLAALREEEPFTLFSRFDLRRRAKRAESFAAEVTVSIHYNTVGPRQQNGLLAFVDGSLLPGELATRSQRYWAIRRLLEGSLGESAALADELLAAASAELGLPLFTDEAIAPLPKKLLLAEHPGVFARNLGLLRRTAGIAVLFEGPPVDHPDEYARLQDRSVTVDGRPAPARAAALADALVRGLLRWLNGGSQ